MRPTTHPPQRQNRKIRSMHGEPWHLRKTIGTNVSREEHQLFQVIAASHGVSVSAYLRALVCDVIVEEGPAYQKSNDDEKQFRTLQHA